MQHVLEDGDHGCCAHNVSGDAAARMHHCGSSGIAAHLYCVITPLWQAGLIVH